MKNIALRIIIITGLVITAVFGVLLIAVNDYSVFTRGQERGFSGLLAEYDYQYRTVMQANTMLRHELDNLDYELDRLERRTEGVESWLSVIKRRRQLAALDPRYMESYRRSSQQAAAEFPHSESIAAVAAASLVYETAINRGNEAQLRNILPLLTDSRHGSLRLGLHVLLGDFSDPEKAAENIPATDLRFGFAGSQPPLEILVNLAIVRLLTGDIQGAAAFVHGALTEFNNPVLTRFAAEYYYDSGNFAHSAELYSGMPGEEALSRQADALWLADYTDSARTIWSILGDTSPHALYNLAITAPTQDESAELLERISLQDTGDPSSRFGLIRYSRLFNPSEAIALLEDAAIREPEDALIDLEILKRRSETGERGRVIADTWALLDSYYMVEDLYQWAAWYFDLQRSSSESAILLRNAARNNLSGQWVNFHNALLHTREGDLDAAERELTAIVNAGDNWAAWANLGRIYEARNAPTRALENYERAVSALNEEAPAFSGDTDRQNTISQLHVRIALCLRTLRRPEESRRSLEFALELNPDNVNARLELNRY
ncbi:MAG: hypothetical protein FWG89_01035 [Treponema sp.]|nr:hypothetical protein [Treponema sp.]